MFTLHALFFALLLHYREPAVPPIKPTSIAMITIDAARPAPAKPPPPALPSKIAKKFEPIKQVSVPAEATSDAAAGASTACSTMGAVLDGLLRDPTTLVSLRTAPPESRSIAGAVMMWNDSWVPAALTPDSPLWSVRANIEATLAKGPDACLNEELVGPRLFPIPETGGNSTLFVVLGSGRWIWRQMITPTPNTTELQAPFQNSTNRQ